MAGGRGRDGTSANAAAGDARAPADDGDRPRRWWRALAGMAASPAAVARWTAALLAVGLLVDLLTPRALVVAVLYDIAIAVSGRARSPRVTGSVVAVALLANLVAAWENAQDVGGWNAIVVANRGFAALSFLVVGAMTAARNTAVDEASERGSSEVSAERERVLRRFGNAVSGAVTVDELVHVAAGALRTLLQADGVVVTRVEDGRFAMLREVDGGNRLVEEGAAAGWAIDVVPTDGNRATTIRTEQGRISVGRWRWSAGAPLVVVVDRPQVEHPTALLGDALDALEPLLRRARSVSGA